MAENKPSHFEPVPGRETAALEVLANNRVPVLLPLHNRRDHPGAAPVLALLSRGSTGTGRAQGDLASGPLQAIDLQPSLVRNWSKSKVYMCQGHLPANMPLGLSSAEVKVGDQFLLKCVRRAGGQPCLGPTLPPGEDGGDHEGRRSVKRGVIVRGSHGVML